MDEPFPSQNTNEDVTKSRQVLSNWTGTNNFKDFDINKSLSMTGLLFVLISYRHMKHQVK